MAELEKRGLAANTLIAFMGDNGASQFRGEGTLYEFGINLPLPITPEPKHRGGKQGGKKKKNGE